MSAPSAFQWTAPLNRRFHGNSSFSTTTPLRKAHGSQYASPASWASWRMSTEESVGKKVKDPFIRELKADPSVWRSIFEKPKVELKKRDDIKKILIIGAGVS